MLKPSDLGQAPVAPASAAPQPRSLAALVLRRRGPLRSPRLAVPDQPLTTRRSSARPRHLATLAPPPEFGYTRLDRTSQLPNYYPTRLNPNRWTPISSITSDPAPLGSSSAPVPRPRWAIRTGGDLLNTRRPSLVSKAAATIPLFFAVRSQRPTTLWFSRTPSVRSACHALDRFWQNNFGRNTLVTSTRFWLAGLFLSISPPTSTTKSPPNSRHSRSPTSYTAIPQITLLISILTPAVSSASFTAIFAPTTA